MSKVTYENLVGREFGELKVIKRVENNKNGQTKWLCKCRCGTETIVHGSNLKSKHTKSCGCFNKKRAIETNLENITGQKFGKLIAHERTKNEKGKYMWMCKCDCGNQTLVNISNLKNGHIKSCGCILKEVIKKRAHLFNEEKYIDLTGKRFGKLLVIKRIGGINSQKRTMWQCKCDCGKIKIIAGKSLTSKNTKSCNKKCFSKKEGDIRAFTKEVLRKPQPFRVRMN